MARPVELPSFIPEEDIALMVIDAGGLDIHELDAGENPFLYSSGNYGPGYVNIKGLVGRDGVFETLTEQSALRLLPHKDEFDFVAGNATGGMVPAFRVRQRLEEFTGQKIPYVYVRNTRKLGGHQEYVTGLEGNPDIAEGAKPLNYEELVNFAETTVNSATVLTDLGHRPTRAGTILNYRNPVAAERLSAQGLTLVDVVGLPTLLDVAAGSGRFSVRAVDDYRKFLQDPPAWMQSRGLERRSQG